MSDRESLFASDLDVLYAACPDKDEDGHCEFCSALDRLVAEARPRWCGRQKTWREHFENVNRQLNRKQVECDDLTERTLDAEADAKRLRYALDLAFATAGFSEARKAHILETARHSDPHREQHYLQGDFVRRGGTHSDRYGPLAGEQP